MGALQFLRGPAGRALGLAAALLIVALTAAGCRADAQAMARTLGDPARGSRLVDTEACGSCHIVPGHANGDGLVGPPLGDFGERVLIAGMLPNTPDNLVLWLQRPQALAPGNGMPDTGLSRQQARDIAAYLYTLD